MQEGLSLDMFYKALLDFCVKDIGTEKGWKRQLLCTRGGGGGRRGGLGLRLRLGLGLGLRHLHPHYNLARRHRHYHYCARECASKLRTMGWARAIIKYVFDDRFVMGGRRTFINFATQHFVYSCGETQSGGVLPPGLIHLV